MEQNWSGREERCMKSMTAQGQSCKTSWAPAVEEPNEELNWHTLKWFQSCQISFLCIRNVINQHIWPTPAHFPGGQWLHTLQHTDRSTINLDLPSSAPPHADFPIIQMTTFNRVNSVLHLLPVLCKFVHQKTDRNHQVQWQKNCNWGLKLKCPRTNDWIMEERKRTRAPAASLSNCQLLCGLNWVLHKNNLMSLRTCKIPAAHASVGMHGSHVPQTLEAQTQSTKQPRWICIQHKIRETEAKLTFLSLLLLSLCL